MFRPPSDMLLTPDQLKPRPRNKTKRAAPAQLINEDDNHSPPQPASPVLPQCSDESESTDPRFDINDPAYKEHKLSGLTTNVKSCQSRVNVIVKPVKWMVKKWKKLVEIEKEWSAEREALRIEKEELKREKEAMRRELEAEKQQRETSRREFEDERRTFKELMSSISARFGMVTGESSRAPNQGRHSISNTSTQEDVQAEVPIPARHSTTGDGALVRRHRRRITPPQAAPAQYIDLTPQEVPIAEAPPRRRRRVRESRHEPDSTPQNDMAAEIIPPVPTYTRESIDADILRYYSQD